MAHLPSIQVGPFKRAQGSIVLPGSKSISNRALLLAALSTGTTTLKNLLDADDTQVMRNALRQLGLSITDQTMYVWWRVVVAASQCAKPNYLWVMQVRRFVH